MIDWTTVSSHLASEGWAVLPSLLNPTECQQLAEMYDQDALFRSRIVMARHGFGKGEYRYFAYPLPQRVGSLRTSLYPPLAEVANEWNARLGVPTRFPVEHEEFLERCHAAGQTRPTPLLLRYAPGDYNCLHQDVYGEHLFPLQATVLLSRPCTPWLSRDTRAVEAPNPAPRDVEARENEYSEPESSEFEAREPESSEFEAPKPERRDVEAPKTERSDGEAPKTERRDGEGREPECSAFEAREPESSDFEGGEFVLVEQRPRMQSRAMVVPLRQGDAVVFAVNQRPVQGARGTYRVTLRHGVSEVRSGHRHTLGIIFHDAT